MVFPAIRSPHTQHELFDIPIKGYRKMAVLIGDLCEVLVANTLQADVFSINGYLSVCPDLIIPNQNAVLEVKGVSRQNVAKLSFTQLAKYEQVYDDGYDVRYAFVIYFPKANYKKGKRGLFASLKYKTVNCLLETMASIIQGILIVDFSIIRALFEQRKDFLTSLYGSPGQEGISIPTSYIVDGIDNPIDFIKSLGLVSKDYLTLQMFMDDITIYDYKASFPLAMVLRNRTQAVKVNPLDIASIRSYFEQQEQLQQEAPF